MKLADALLISFALALIIIGIHQSMTRGVEGSYPIFMFAVALLFWFQYRRIKQPEKGETPKKTTKTSKKR
jgi:hypothetical protein